MTRGAGETGPFWPGTRVLRSRGNAFDWDNGTPSIFSERVFRPTQTGESYSAAASRVVQNIAADTGRNPGTITHLIRDGKPMHAVRARQKR